jgi:hypothetical protein
VGRPDVSDVFELRLPHSSVFERWAFRRASIAWSDRNGSRKPEHKKKQAENPTLENRQGWATPSSNQKQAHPPNIAAKRY